MSIYKGTSSDDSFPKFFKVYLPGELGDDMDIPVSFNSFLPRSLPKKVIVRSIYGKSWKLKLRKRCGEIEKFSMVDGWKRIVKDEDLKGGEFLTFEFDGSRLFNFCIFGQATCKRLGYSVETKDVEDESDGEDDTSSDDIIVIDDDDDDDDDDDEEEEDEDEDEDDDDDDDGGDTDDQDTGGDEKSSVKIIVIDDDDDDDEEDEDDDDDGGDTGDQDTGGDEKSSVEIIVIDADTDDGSGDQDSGDVYKTREEGTIVIDDDEDDDEYADGDDGDDDERRSGVETERKE